MRLALHLALTALRSISGGIMTLEERLEPTGTNEPPRRSFTGASWAPVPDVIENPVINSPYEGPRRHFVFGNEGITNQIAEGRRASTFFIPITPPKQKEAQLQIEGMMTADRMRPNALINRIRDEVALWRQRGLPGHQPDDLAAARPLAEPHPRASALLLSDRGGGDGVHTIFVTHGSHGFLPCFASI